MQIRAKQDFGRLKAGDVVIIPDGHEFAPLYFEKFDPPESQPQKVTRSKAARTGEKEE